MNTLVKSLKESVLQLFYPHICAGCGTDTLPINSNLCVKCLYELPATGFEKIQNNPIEKMLIGRVETKRATAQFYFHKHAMIQTLMHQFKYKGNIKLGRQLGMIMGGQLLQSKQFDHIDMLIPLPLHSSKVRQRGFNQSEVLCKGISEVMKVPVVTDAVKRISATATQTKKNRIERWKNMEGRFVVVQEEIIKNKQLLLVDDVITTGATLEACGTALKEIEGTELSIATLCCASFI